MRSMPDNILRHARYLETPGFAPAYPGARSRAANKKRTLASWDVMKSRVHRLGTLRLLDTNLCPMEMFHKEHDIVRLSARTALRCVMSQMARELRLGRPNAGTGNRT